MRLRVAPSSYPSLGRPGGRFDTSAKTGRNIEAAGAALVGEILGHNDVFAERRRAKAEAARRYADDDDDLECGVCACGLLN